MYNQLKTLEITLQFINFKYAVLYIGLIIVIIFGLLEVQKKSEYNPIGQNLEVQPIMQASLQDKCDEDQETISYYIQSTVIGCYCQGNKRYSCSELQIKQQGCIPIMSSTGISLSRIPFQPKSKQYRGIQLCVKHYKGLNLRQQIEEKNILQPQDCTGDYKICGNETAFFCIHKNESSCPIANLIFSNQALSNSDLILVNNINNSYFLYVENNQTQYIADFQLIDGNGVCLDRNQISLSENKTSYELDFIPASNCTIDETYYKFTEYNQRIFEEVNNFSFSQFLQKTRPFYDEEQSNIKLNIQKLQSVSNQCRYEIHNYLQNKDNIILNFKFLLYFQLLALILPLIQLFKNKLIIFIYVIATYFIVLGLGIWQVQSLYDYKKVLNSMCDICQFQKQEDILDQSIIYQLLLIAIVIVITIPTYLLYKTLLKQQANPQQPEQELGLVGAQVVGQAGQVVGQAGQVVGQAGQVVGQVVGQVGVGVGVVGQLEGQDGGQDEGQVKGQVEQQVQQQQNYYQKLIVPTKHDMYTGSQESQTFRGAQSNDGQSN